MSEARLDDGGGGWVEDGAVVVVTRPPEVDVDVAPGALVEELAFGVEVGGSAVRIVTAVGVEVVGATYFWALEQAERTASSSAQPTVIARRVNTRLQASAA